MKTSIVFKIYAVFLLITVLLSGLILLITFRTTRHFHIDVVAKDLENLATAISVIALPLVEEQRTDELDSMVRDLGQRMETRITIISPDGTVLADSEEDPTLMENHGARSEIVDALSKGLGRSRRYSTTVSEEMLYVAIPLIEADQILGTVRVSLFLKNIDNLLGNLRDRILETVLVIVILSLAGAILFSRRLSGRIKRLSAASCRIAGGDFGTEVLIPGKDELKELADNFNNMAATVKDLFERLSSQKNKMDSVIASIQEGLVVIDREGTIIMANTGFMKIAGDATIEGRPYWAVLRAPGFRDFIERLKDEKKNLLDELEIKGNTYLCSAALLRPSEEAVIMFHDVTEFRKLERIKKDFVINVSHELRTPLTVIKGFAETLIEEKEGEERKYLETIARHTDRLTHIVKDLLSLSELEEKGAEISLQDVDVLQLIEHILSVLDHRLKEKDLDVRLEVKGEIPTIQADRFRLEQLFINLLDNAVKYTDRGGITIILEPAGREISVRISDTGIGISQEHQSRIFERFYVTDKSRSRTLGGTGLGLSIVKHIVLAHNGEITVESTPGRGSTFKVTLPVSQP